MKYGHHKLSAFSLIELLVSVTILMLIVGGAVAGYTRYTERQRVVAAAEKIQSGLRRAQNMAITGYLSSCNELNYIQSYTYISGGNLTHRIRVYCENADPVSYINHSYETIASDFIIDADFIVRFYPLGYSDRDISRNLTCTRNGYQATFNIEQGGSIKVTYQ